MKRRMLGVGAALVVLGAAAFGCSDNTTTPAPDAGGGDASTDIAVVDGSTDAGVDVPVTPTDVPTRPSLPEGDCDPLDPSECAFPWPSNLYLRADTARATGHTLRFGPTSLPANRNGVHIAAEPFERMDGYGLGVPVMTRFPNIDITMMATEDHPERSLATDAPALLFEVQGTQLVRVPYFVELDLQESDAARKTLFLRPLTILKEGTRYVVAFRNLRTTGGQTIAPSPAFARLQGGMTTGDMALASRQARFNEVFTLLEAAGIARTSLTLAWDFHTASSQALHGHMLAMRDDALRRFPMGPTLTVTGTQEFVRTADGTGRDVNPNIALQIDGTIEVPDYTRGRLFGTAMTRVLNLDAMGNPTPSGMRTVPFSVRVPHSAIGGQPHGLVQYGHGLLGGGDEVEAGYNGRIANNNNLIFFATSLSGMSTEDVPVVLQALRDGSAFQGIGDRLQQGFVQWILLARAMKTQFATLPAVTSHNIRINPDELFYSGISQGGIFGGSYVALSPDITRGHLGVPGNNYVTLLNRSVDFQAYFALARMSYTDSADQALLLAALQLHWDHTDPVSYYRHLSAAPFPGNTAHSVLLAPAKGDYEVAVFTNEIAARSDMGIALMANYDVTRMPFGLTPTAYPHRGSAVVLYDFGNAWPRLGNVPPLEDPRGNPHGQPRQQTYHDRQMVTFLRTGEVIDVCGGDGCRPD